MAIMASADSELHGTGAAQLPRCLLRETLINVIPASVGIHNPWIFLHARSDGRAENRIHQSCL